MSDGTANHDVESRGWAGGPETGGWGDAAVSADAIGERCRADPAGVHATTTRHSFSAAWGFAKYRDRFDRRRRTRSADDFRGRGPHGNDGSDGRRRRRLQPVPHHCHVLTDAGIASDLVRASRDRNGQIAELANDWDGYAGKIPRSSALVAEVLKDYGYSSGCLGQVAQHPGGGHDGGRPVRGLAHRTGLRVFLRVPGGGGLAVRAAPCSQHHCRGAAEDPGGGLSPFGGLGRRCDQLAAEPQGAAGRSDHSSCTGPADACTARTTS